MEHSEKTAEGIYAHLEADREPYLCRAREAAEVTIPHLVPREGQGNQSYYSTFQSLGAHGLNNLASKLMLILMPPGRPFFRLKADEMKVNEQEKEDPNLRADLETTLSGIERAVLDEAEHAGVRTATFAAVRQLLVSGNVLMKIPRNNDKAQMFRMDQYVVDRDPMGNVLCVVTKEKIAMTLLPEEMLEIILASEEHKGKDDIEIYTKMWWKEGKWHIHQEVLKTIVPGTEGSFKEEEPPFIALWWTKEFGQNWAHGFIEESLGDLISLERLSEALLDGSEAAAKVIFMVHPNSTTSPKELAQVRNGGFINGALSDVEVLQLNKQADFSVVAQTIAQLRDALGRKFLMNASVQRKGERVTAEEIRFMAQELEDALGGVYSVLAQEFQVPLVNSLMARMKGLKKLPDLPKDLIKPSIVAGLDALGRSRDLTQIQTALTGMMQVVGPEVVGAHLRLSNLFKLVFANLGVDIDSLVKSEEEMEQAKQEQAQQAAMQQALPNAVNQLGQAAQQEPQV